MARRILKLSLSQLACDRGTQPRYVIDDDTVAIYAEEMQNGDSFPPLTVFHDGKKHYLADGFHRKYAAESINRKNFACDVRKGTLRDAILYSVGANAVHGLPRTNNDKWWAVKTLLDDKEWVKWSDVKIAKQCAVHQTFVSKVRKELSKDNLEIPAPRKVKRGNTEYEMDTSAIGSKSQKSEPQTKEDDYDEEKYTPVLTTLAERYEFMWNQCAPIEHKDALKWMRAWVKKHRTKK